MQSSIVTRKKRNEDQKKKCLPCTSIVANGRRDEVVHLCDFFGEKIATCAALNKMGGGKLEKL